MHSFQALAILAFAGSAIAAPAPLIVYETVVHTAVVTEIVGQAPAPQTPAPPAPAVETVVVKEYRTWAGRPHSPKSSAVVVVAPSSTPPPPPPPSETPKPEPIPEATPEPAPTPAPSAVPAPPSGSTGYMKIVDEYRQKMGLSPLKNSDLLSKHALGVVTKNNGQMIHEIVNLQQNPSVKSTGQVLAPGKAPGDEGEENFKKVFVGGWLCELSSLPGLEGECATMSDGWSYVDPATGKAQTGHAEILSSKDFTHIGCGWFNGQWCCDLGVIEEGSEGY